MGNELLICAAPNQELGILITLDDDEKTLFPKQTEFLVSYKDEPSGPFFGVIVGVKDGRPAISSFCMLTGEAPPLTGAKVHQTAFGTIFKEVIAYAAKYALMIQSTYTGTRTYFSGRVEMYTPPSELPTALDFAHVGLVAASAAQHGRPVRAETLKRVAEIVRANSFNPRTVIKQELGVSLRTASRYIVQAKKCGMLDTDGKD
jgi:hypothetical protein